MITLIAALTKDRVISKDNKIPWDLPEEKEFFHNVTKGHPVIMGRLTFESIGHPLSERENFVLSRTLNKLEGVQVFTNLDEALEKAKEFGEEIFILGGEEVFKETLPLADKILLSWVDGDFEGDRFFPDFSMDKWELAKRDAHRTFLLEELRRKYDRKKRS